MDRHYALKFLKRGRDGIAEWNRRRNARETIPDLSDAYLRGADLSEANLRDANLSRADLCGANLRDANLSGAFLRYGNLSRANLSDANLGSANLSLADLSHANLSLANLRHVYLGGANLKSAILNATAFSSVNLSEAQGLELVAFHGPCSVGVDTLVASKGQIPESFLRSCGLQPWQILETRLYDPALTPAQISDLQYKIFTARTKGPLLIGGVFISYSHADAAFVDNVHQSLQDDGVPVWLDRHDLVAGPLGRQVVDAIRLNDVVLLVLSESSVNSDWVDYELKRALEKERDEHRGVLCPVALDTAWVAKTEQVLWHRVRDKNVLDFSQWATDAFTPQFSKLLKGLKIYYTLPDK